MINRPLPRWVVLLASIVTTCAALTVAAAFVLRDLRFDQQKQICEVLVDNRFGARVLRDYIVSSRPDWREDKKVADFIHYVDNQLPPIRCDEQAHPVPVSVGED